MNKDQPLAGNRLPWWTWVLPLVLCHIGTEISLLSKVTTGTSLLYFPSAISVVLVCWWGPRVLPACYLNATLSAGLWGLDRVALWPVYAAPEVIFVFLSWLFFIKLSKGKFWLPNIQQTVLFLMLGIIIPLFIYKLIQEEIFLFTGDLQVSGFWNRFVATILGDFISLFGLTIPTLYFLTRPVARRRLAFASDEISDRLYLVRKEFDTPKRLTEFLVIMCLLVVLSQTLKLADYWFVYGSIALYTALRWGIGIVILVNSFILVITYLMPSIFDSHFISSMMQNNEMLKIQLGSSLLYVFSTVTGRVMTDVGVARRALHAKNEELERANKELDRFVYSVSHDLSAPLKSIQGLVTISLMDDQNIHKVEYLKKITQSAAKLDFFIKEILDYSRNKRTALELEEIQLMPLCEEVIDNLRYMDHFQTMNFDLNEIKDSVIYSDRLRLKIIFNNLFSNAIKFQKKRPDESPFLQVRLKKDASRLQIIVRDNGEGIREEHQEKIFDMFFRANKYATGSGLGLYIAQETAEKLGGKLMLKSVYGEGSEFIVELP